MLYSLYCSLKANTVRTSKLLLSFTMNFPPLQFHVSQLSYSISGVSKELKITILNKSGSKANYAVFSGKPTIQSRPPKDIRQYYLDAAYGVDYTYGRAEFNLSKQKYCVCGSLDGSPEATVNAPLRATALNQMPVILGYKKPDGTLIMGTTCNVVADPGDSPSFSHDKVAARGDDGAFCIQNDSQFTLPTAKDGKPMCAKDYKQDEIRH